MARRSQQAVHTQMPRSAKPAMCPPGSREVLPAPFDAPQSRSRMPAVMQVDIGAKVATTVAAAFSGAEKMGTNQHTGKRYKS